MLPGSSRCLRRIEEKIVGVKGDGGHKENMGIQSTKQGSYSLTESEEASTRPAWVCIRSFTHML